MKNKIPFPYKLKNTSIGWWGDGYCGYLYVGYFDAEEAALIAFWERYRRE